jgi:hypothetical protein
VAAVATIRASLVDKLFAAETGHAVTTLARFAIYLGSIEKHGNSFSLISVISVDSAGNQVSGNNTPEYRFIIP